MRGPMFAQSRQQACFVLLVALLTSGCAIPKIAPDLLTGGVEVRTKPLIANAAWVKVSINPAINNWEGIDESVKQSLELALKNAKLFGSNASNPYTIDAHILTASQAAFSFGSFNGKLEIRYVVSDASGAQLIDKTIFTVAGSDKMYFSGEARHRRARAVNIAKNVMEFVIILDTQLQKK
jgi:hypothetical protein